MRLPSFDELPADSDTLPRSPVGGPDSGHPPRSGRSHSQSDDLLCATQQRERIYPTPAQVMGTHADSRPGAGGLNWRCEGVPTERWRVAPRPSGG